MKTSLNQFLKSDVDICAIWEPESYGFNVEYNNKYGTVSATPVSESQARQKALNFVSSKMSTHSGAMSIQSLPQLTRVEGVDNSAAYIYNIDGGGFVIVSGDSRMHDILAYTPAALLMPRICPLQCSGGSANARPQQHV